MNYFTQTDNLLSGVWRGIKDNTVGLIESLPQAIPMLKELIKGVAGGQINIVDLMKALLSSAVADYWHVIRSFGTLSPFQKNTDAEVYRYGRAVGRVGTEIVLSMVGANIANNALKLLKGSAVGKKIVALANRTKGLHHHGVAPVAHHPKSQLPKTAPPCLPPQRIKNSLELSLFLCKRQTAHSHNVSGLSFQT